LAVRKLEKFACFRKQKPIFFAFNERQSEILSNCRCKALPFSNIIKEQKSTIKYFIYLQKNNEEEEWQILSIEVTC